jgi:hypothetical protein
MTICLIVCLLYLCGCQYACRRVSMHAYNYVRDCTCKSACACLSARADIKKRFSSLNSSVRRGENPDTLALKNRLSDWHVSRVVMERSTRMLCASSGNEKQKSPHPFLSILIADMKPTLSIIPFTESGPWKPRGGLFKVVRHLSHSALSMYPSMGSNAFLAAVIA